MVKVIPGWGQTTNKSDLPLYHADWLVQGAHAPAPWREWRTCPLFHGQDKKTHKCVHWVETPSRTIQSPIRALFSAHYKEPQRGGFSELPIHSAGLWRGQRSPLDPAHRQLQHSRECNPSQGFGSHSRRSVSRWGWCLSWLHFLRTLFHVDTQDEHQGFWKEFILAHEYGNIIE